MEPSAQLLTRRDLRRYNKSIAKMEKKALEKRKQRNKQIVTGATFFVAGLGIGGLVVYMLDRANQEKNRR